MAAVKINAIEVPEGDGPEPRYFVVTHWESDDDFQAWLKGPAAQAQSGERARPVASGTSLLEFEVVQPSTTS